MKGWNLRNPIKSLLNLFTQFRFFGALKTKNYKSVSKLIRKRRRLFSIQQYQTGLGPLHVLIRDEHQALLQQILARNDIKSHINNQDNEQKWAPIHFATSTGRFQFVQSLANLSCNLQIKTKKGISSLHIAAANNSLQIAKFLIKQGVFTDLKDIENQWTPLNYSAFHNHFQMTQLLLSNKAKPGSIDKIGLTPLYSAITGNAFQTTKLLHQYKQSYLQEKALVKPVHLASRLQSPDILSFLIQQGHDIRKLDNQVILIQQFQASCLHYAALSSSLKCAQVLLQKGLSPNLQDASGSTPLHLAVIEGNRRMVELLLKKGAKKSIYNQKGLTADQVALSMKKSAIISIFKKY